MRVIEEDIVDGEPLEMRFVTRPDTPPERVTALASHLKEWFLENAGEARDDCDLRYWQVKVAEPCVVEALAEHLLQGALRRLSESVENAFPEVDELRLGVPVAGIPSGLDFEWVNFPEEEVRTGRGKSNFDPFAVSLHAVSVGQFTEFLEATGYQPDADRREGLGFLVDYLRMNWGPSPKIPAFGATYNDARAYCEWAGLRLPSEPELYHFFRTLALRGYEFDWGGECWTSTPGPDGTYVVLNDPYRGCPDLRLENFVQYLAPEYYEYPHPCFRIARSLSEGHS
ncbi:MAG TPA: SUMF1/EgtB/PvdO family nonheme iron enzyme [Gemmataceae bacterium]